MKRRHYLGAVAGVAALTGCSSDDPSSGDSGSTPGETATATDTDADATDATATETETETETETDSPTPSGPEEAIIGEVVASDQLSMVVRGTTTTRQLGQFQEADSGNTFLVVNLAVKNRSSSEFADFSSLLQTTLVDGESYSYTQSISTGASAFQGGQLAPGEVTRGTIPFEVPQDASDFELQFDFSAVSFTSINRVFIDLSETAASVGDVEQTLQVPINAIGDTIERGNTAVTMNSVEFANQIGGQFGSEAESGNEFAIVDLSVANNTNEDLSISPSLQMAMKDSTGASYSSSLVATSQLDQSFEVGSPIASGRSRRGTIAFEVPQDSSTLYLTFEFSLFATGNKTFWQAR